MNWVQIYNILMPNKQKLIFKVEAMKCVNSDCPHQWHVHLETYIANEHYGATIINCESFEEACKAIDRITFEQIANVGMNVYNDFYKSAEDAIRKASGN